MCGRFALGVPRKVVEETFSVAVPEGYRPRYNLAPGMDALVLLQGEGGRVAEFFRWGLKPSWSDEAASGRGMINARSETVFAKPAFRGAARSRPCLVPAQFFYEWSAQGQGGKTPHAIRPKGAQVFAMAGIWEAWDKGEHTFAVLTMEANAAAAAVHPRMPVMLDPEGCASWLAPGEGREEVLAALVRACSAMPLEIRAVSRAVNNPANDHAGLLESGPEQAGLPV